MAVTASFKQQCPSCEAMISIKEEKIGKKVECTKCKDKFIAKKPVEDELEVEDLEVEEEPQAKKSTKVNKKTAATAVTTKSPPAGKRPKLEVDEEEEDEAPAKNGKSKTSSNGKAKNKSKKADEDDDEADKPKKKDTKKLTIGLAIAGVGVVILIVAAVFVLKGRTPPAPRPPVPGGPGVVEQPGDKPGGPKPVDLGKPEFVAEPLDRAKLSNMLPGDAEHVFHANFKDLFEMGTSLRSAVFETPGALDDAELKRRLGFSVLAIDDVLLAEKVTVPWRFTILHFRELVKEDDLKAALKLKAVGKGIDGQTYYKMSEPNPTFEHLSRFSFGVPNILRSIEQPGNRPTYLRLHNPQTLIIANEVPMVAFLKAKGQFPMQSTPAGPKLPPPGTMGGGVGGGMTGVPPVGGMTGVPPVGGMTGVPPSGGMTGIPPMPGGSMTGIPPMPMPGGGMTGIPPGPGFPPGGPKRPPKGPMGGVGSIPGPHTEYTGLQGAEEFTLQPAQPMPMPMPLQPVQPGVGGQPVQPVQPGVGGQPVQPGVGGQPGPKGGDPKTDPGPGPGPSPKIDPNPMPGAGGGDHYMTIKPALKSILDRMESGPDKEKVLFSSATDMEATVIDTRAPGFKTMVPRKARQFWDVTLLINETKPRIRYLGTALVERDTRVYRLRNEITCGEEIFAKEIKQQMTERIAASVARFIGQLVEHEVAVHLTPPPVVVAPPPPPDPGKPEGKPEENKSNEPTKSQITVTQDFTRIDFVLDLMLDGPTQSRTASIASLTASVLRVETEAASLSVRHQLAAAGKAVGEKGLSQRQIQVPPGKLPPGAFNRLNDPDKPPPMRFDKEPKNRISFMAGMLPYMGHQNLFDKIKFDQSWRGSGNWMPGSTIVPQFLDPTYPDSARQVAFGDLPVDFAATHYVGIAGVGLDAASYKRGDPATIHKRGAFSYDDSASIAEIQAGRGTSNVALMIQVPHDSVTGVSPWIAGGGATLRGVPEKNSIAPFVSTNQDKKRGTMVMMADGTVRFVDQNVSDEVFKAMCTISGPTPPGFDVAKDPNIMEIPAPKNLKDAKEQKAAPPKTPPVDKTPPKEQPKKEPLNKEPGKTPAVAPDDLSALQGVWVTTYAEFDGKPAPDLVLSSMRWTIDGNKLLEGEVGKNIGGTFRIDSTKSPKHIDQIRGDGLVNLGIYEFKNGDLRVCMAFTNKGTQAVRPSTFATQPGWSGCLSVMKKQKQ